MYCTQCDQHLSRCTCPDLQERLERLSRSKHVLISPENMATYEAQAKKNIEEQQVSE